MKILLTNDDGYQAPGITMLARELANFAQVLVVAPEGNRSGASSSLSLGGREVTLRRVANNVWSVSGTPADCAHLTLTGAFSFVPDLVVSGINGGANMGDDTVYSGTVGAAREGYIAGIDSIALSQVEAGWAHLADAVDISADICRKVLERDRGEGDPLFLNVNFPMLPADEIDGIEVTRLGRRAHALPAFELERGEGFLRYRLGFAGEPQDAGEGTDFCAVARNRVSVTPIGVDITRFGQVQTAAELFRRD